MTGTYVVHTHYVRGTMTPAEVMVVPLDGEWEPWAEPSPVPPGRDLTPPDFPWEWWSRALWHGWHDGPDGLAAHLAAWHRMDTALVTVAQPVPADGSQP